MKRRILWLTSASIVYGSPHVFSVTDDLLAYPQYEVIFSESYISDTDASSRLSYAAAISSTDSATSTNDASASTHGAELSHRQPASEESTDSNSPNHASSIPQTYERMILNSTPYLCSIPQPPPQQTNHTTAAKAAEEEAAELARATDRGWDLLQEMSGNCLYFISGWWSYSFCYANSVKQFHQLPPGKDIPMFPPVEDPTTPSYILGRFGEKVNRHRLPAGEAGIVDGGLEPESGAGTTTTIQAKGSSSSRYLSQKLTGGTTCDLTGSPRRVEVQFHCHPQSADRIGWIKEVSTCSYLMVVHTPRLCNDVAFLPPREETADPIACREIVKEEDVSEWTSRKSREAERKLVGDGGAAKNAKPSVGGIEVGGMKLVGRDGKKLEVPQNIYPSNHGHGGYAADSSNGDQRSEREFVARQFHTGKGWKVQRITDDELKKLGLNVKTTEAAIKEIQQVAKGKGWRLDVVEAEGGRELRGIVDGDEESEEEEYRDEGKGFARGVEGDDERRGPEGEDEGDEQGEDGEEQGSFEEYRDEL